MRIVIKLGGSILFKDTELNFEVVRKWLEAISALADRHKIVVVVGGGSPARQYIGWARDLGLSEFECDTLGILVSRLNAKLLTYLARREYKELRVFWDTPSSVYDLPSLIDTYDIVFCGGFVPGQSTIGVATEVCEAIGSKHLFVATDVDGIYNKNPKHFPDAKKVDIITASELIEMFAGAEQIAGTYRLFDLQSLKIIQRSGIIVTVFDGRNIDICVDVIEKVLARRFDDAKKFASIVYPH